jgi:large subunit ribosomal protein L35
LKNGTRRHEGHEPGSFLRCRPEFPVQAAPRRLDASDLGLIDSSFHPVAGWFALDRERALRGDGITQALGRRRRIQNPLNRVCRNGIAEEFAIMPKLKTHKGMKKRFKVSATGKVSHKRCGSSHLMSHKSGKRVRRLRKSTTLKVAAEARRIRDAMLEKQSVNPVHVVTLKHDAVLELADKSKPPEPPAGSAAAPAEEPPAATAPAQTE